MIDEFVQLDRAFREVSEDDIETDESNDEYAWSLWGDHDRIGWADLERRFRTVILAEGGAGKTREMKERSRMLRHEGKNAWFIELEMLADEDIEKLLDLDHHLPAFEGWRNSSIESGWFFLDAVDELKLKDGDFRKALFNLRRSLGHALERSRIVISCRPSDWDKIDLVYFKEQLPAPKVSENSSGTPDATRASESTEERFLAPLRGNPGMGSEDIGADLAVGNTAEPERLKIFRLGRLDRSQVRKFVAARAPEFASEILRSVENDDRWDFARQPQDLLELIELWADKQSLGTLKRQHESFVVSSLREREGRPSSAVSLSLKRAREGAERLALSLTLSKKRTILNVSESTTVGNTRASVCPRELLQDWDSGEIKALLRLRIFDPPSYGRIKFHRRDLQEYLAAGRLIGLAKAGNDSIRRLCSIIFSKNDSGELVLLPSMRSIAAWVASDSSELAQRIRALITRIEPELLLEGGDPEELPLPSRIKILSRIADLQLGASPRRLSYSPSSLKRFAAPNLAETLETIFERAQGNDSVVSLVLAMAKEGKISECSGMLAKVAMTHGNSNHWRALAVMGLVGCKQDEHLAKIVQRILGEPQHWPTGLLSDIIDELVPDHLTVGQLEALLRDRSQGMDSRHPDLSQPIQRLADKLEGGTPVALELKRVLSSMILGHQLPGSAHYHPTSLWADLSPALQTLCLAGVRSTSNAKTRQHVFDCLTALWFRPRSYYGSRKPEEIVAHVASLGLDRALLFQWELEFALNHFPSKLNSPTVVHRSLIKGYTQADAPWLERIVKSKRADVRIRLSALLGRVRFWNSQGRPQEEEGQLRALGGDGGIIDEHLNQYLAPKENSADLEWEATRRAQEDQEQRRLDGWCKWRRGVIKNPVSSFSGERLERNRHLILQWLMADSGKSGSYLVWGRGKGVATAFSEKTKSAAASAFLKSWPTADVKLYSEQTGDRSGTPYAWIYALTGVSILSEKPGWARKLTDDEVRQATRIATVEINGLAGYIEQLISDRPAPVKEVLVAELVAQWNLGSKVPHLPLLQYVANGSPAVKKLLHGAVISLLLDWSVPTGISKEATGWISHHLSELIAIIQTGLQEVSPTQKKALENHCKDTLRNDPDSPFAVYWLRLLFALDTNSGIEMLKEAISLHPRRKKKNAAVRFFAALFGHGCRPVSISPEGGAPAPRLLGELILLAYTHIIPSEDENRPSGVSYTPNDRDDAQFARSAFVNRLIENEGPAADREIARLIASPQCEPIKGYLSSRKQIREKNSAEREYSVADISEIEIRFEAPPRDRDALFRVMMARLEDLQDFLETDDFVPLLTLRRIDSEEEMQRMLSMLLKQTSNGTYEVLREAEVKGRKRTDIQFCVPGSDVQSVIEVKLGEMPAWTVSKLLDALESQLVDRYLLQRNRRAGCFLVTYGGHDAKCSKCGDGVSPRKTWKDPDSGKSLTFDQLIDRLRVRAREIVQEHNYEIRLEVFGLDLRESDL